MRKTATSTSALKDNFMYVSKYFKRKSFWIILLFEIYKIEKSLRKTNLDLRMILTPDDCKFCGKMSATPQFWQSRLPAHYRSVRRGRGPGIGAALAIPISKSLYDIYLSSAPYNYLGRKQTLDTGQRTRMAF